MNISTKVAGAIYKRKERRSMARLKKNKPEFTPSSREIIHSEAEKFKAEFYKGMEKLDRDEHPCPDSEGYAFYLKHRKIAEALGVPPSKGQAFTPTSHDVKIIKKDEGIQKHDMHYFGHVEITVKFVPINGTTLDELYKETCANLNRGSSNYKGGSG